MQNTPNKVTKLTRVDGTTPCVILAEDSYPVRGLLAALLEKMGCKVFAVEHGEHALSTLDENHVDLIIMDIEMPVMDGFQATQHIRELSTPKATTPIIALSAFLADIPNNHSHIKFFNHRLAKPVTGALLGKIIQDTLDNSNQHMMISDNPRDPKEKSTTPNNRFAA